MKKILVGLLAFSIGVAGFNLFKAKPQAPSVKIAPVEITVDVSTPPVKPAAPEKPEALKPFFDSFKTVAYDENNEYQGYAGWLIADEFKGMKEVWTILLDRGDEGSTNGKLVWSAMILTTNTDGSPNDDDDFSSVWIKAESDHLSFRTNKVRGIEYRFDGKFFKNGKDFAEDQKVLRGTMQKIVRGKVVAKFTDDFAYFEPHCFH